MHRRVHWGDSNELSYEDGSSKPRKKWATEVRRAHIQFSYLLSGVEESFVNHLAGGRCVCANTDYGVPQLTAGVRIGADNYPSMTWSANAVS